MKTNKTRREGRGRGGGVVWGQWGLLSCLPPSPSKGWSATLVQIIPINKSSCPLLCRGTQHFAQKQIGVPPLLPTLSVSDQLTRISAFLIRESPLSFLHCGPRNIFIFIFYFCSTLILSAVTEHRTFTDWKVLSLLPFYVFIGTIQSTDRADG